MSRDSKDNAVGVANQDYGLEWQPEHVQAMPDPHASGVWLLAHRKSGVALAVNIDQDRVVDEFDYDEVMSKYGSQMESKTVKLNGRQLRQLITEMGGDEYPDRERYVEPDDYDNATSAENALDSLSMHFQEDHQELEALKTVMKVIYRIQEM